MQLLFKQQNVYCIILSSGSSTMAALKIFYHLSFVNVIMNIIINLGNQLLTKGLSINFSL